MRNSKSTIFAAAVSLLLAACFQDGGMHGGDDYPNSVEPLGKHAAQETRDSSEWNAYGDAPAGSQGAYDTARVPDAPPSQNAPKRGAMQLLLPNLYLDLGTEIGAAIRNVVVVADAGALRAVRVQVAGTFSTVDTTWYMADSLGGHRLLRVSGYVAVNGDIRYSVFEDGDGDGFLSPRAGSQNIVNMRFTRVLADGRREEKVLRVGAGPDQDYNRADDNGLYAMHKTLVQGLDTLLSVLLRDMDGDGFLFNPLRDSSRIEVESRWAEAGGRTLLTYRLNLFADSARNYPYRYRRERTLAVGTETTVALGRDSMPDFRAGDTGSVRVSFVGARSTDTLVSSESRYGVLLSTQAGNASGNRLLSVTRVKNFRAGPVSRFAFALRPGTPVMSGSFARTGAITARADLAAGGWVQFSGEAAGDLSGTVQDSEGRTGTITFAADGTIKSAAGF
jgi:hypothetical protein